MPQTILNVTVLPLTIMDVALRSSPPFSFAIAAGVPVAALYEPMVEVMLKRDFIYVFCFCMAPDDADKRARMKESHDSTILNDALTRIKRENPELLAKIVIDGNKAISLTESKRFMELIPSIDKDSDRLARYASAFILRWLIARWRDPLTRKDASLAKAIKPVIEFCGSNNIHTGSTEQNIRRYWWNKYKSVSHFWAAYYLLCEEDKKRTYSDSLLDFYDWYGLFLRTSDFLMTQASQIVHKNKGKSGAPVLALDTAWRVPEEYLQDFCVGPTDTAVWSDELRVHDIRNFNLIGGRV